MSENRLMNTAAVAFCVAFISTSTVLAEQLSVYDAAHWDGEYICKVDDNVEVSNGTRSAGTNVMDSDGVLSDPEVELRAEVKGGTLRLQGYSAGDATQGFDSYVITSSGEAKRGPYLKAEATEILSQRLMQLLAMTDSEAGLVGLFLTTHSYSTPALRDGETFAVMDTVLAHCKKM